MNDSKTVFFVIGPTASGKSARAIELARAHDGEVISVDSRQVYRTLDIGTEKITPNDMQGVPHHLIDIRNPEENYSAGEFAHDALQLISDIHARGKHAVLAGGSHFYFDALLHGLPVDPPRNEEKYAARMAQEPGELFAEIRAKDPARAARLDPNNTRRLVRALEILDTHETVPVRTRNIFPYTVEWIVVDAPREELRARLEARLAIAISRGLVEEVERTRARVSDERLAELGLEYRIVGEYLRGELTETELLPKLNAKLWQYAKRQKSWIRKLTEENNVP